MTNRGRILAFVLGAFAGVSDCLSQTACGPRGRDRRHRREGDRDGEFASGVRRSDHRLRYVHSSDDE